ncbi:MAG TPA: RIP metalloprotease RseP, partial [Aliiroseovarius sp.]|nr:RIP metalloprotease RseP [Aliiroseovarius sp.]
SIGIFAGFAMYQGVATDPLTVANLPQMPGLERSLQPGDRILEIDGVKTPALEDFGDFVDTLPATSPLEYRVDRDGIELVVEAPHPFPALVSGISPGSAAMEAGLQPGDLILAINGIEVPTFDSMRQIVGDGDGAPLVLDLIRDGQPMTVTLTPRKVDLPTRDGGFETRWLIGITGGFLFEPATRRTGVVESLQAGVSQTKYIITASLSGLYHMVAGKISSCNLRGPIGIAQTSGQAAAQGIPDFVWFIGVLSTAVGLLNLFPIPILDGGHLVFHAWEAVAGKPPSDRVLNVLMTIGLVLVLGLMIFGLTNDLRCP